MMVIASNILLHKKLLETAENASVSGACILAHEKPDTEHVPQWLEARDCVQEDSQR
jgi:hypothetical protein